MTALRDFYCGMVTIGILVAAGFWGARYSETEGFGRLTPNTASNGHDRVISARRAAWLPQGDRVLTLTTGGVNSSNRLMLHDLAGAGRELTVEFEGDSVSSLSISPDGRHALIGTSNGRLWWLNLDSSEQTLLVTLRAAITASSISHSGRLAAIADHLGRIFLWSITINESASSMSRDFGTSCPTDGVPSQLVMLSQNPRTSSRDIRFSESDDRLLCCGNDGSLRIWELPTGNLLQSFHGCRNIVTAAAFLPGNDQILSACLDDTIRIWDVASGRETWRGQFGCLGVNTLALSPNGKTAVWGGYNGKIYVWNVEQSDMATVIDSPASIIWELRFSPDGKSIVAACQEGRVRVYNVLSGAQQCEIPVDVI